jgi:hypothetical protein
MIIDEVINPNQLKIKVDKTTIDRTLGDVPEPFPNKTGFLMTLIAPTGAGKSQMLSNMFCNSAKSGRIYNKRWDNVIYCTPAECMNSIDDDDHAFKNHDKVHHVLTPELINQFIEDAKEAKASNLTTAIILDDYSDQMRGDKKFETMVHKMVSKARHYNIGLFVSLTTTKCLPLKIRSITSYFMLWRPRSIQELNVFADEIIDLPKKAMTELCEYVFDRPYTYLFINAKNGDMYKNSNKLIIKR